eukprot:TRINITY_DN444_c0_g1_i1.p1 TRINITY_DN444_c0_g1~~TRINITY_DN444_c0_g1_i1.p1  ORF type:complete len:153 (+),score=46.76 TRINITY_DN444_c0_g1_i1:58-516(+)
MEADAAEKPMDTAESGRDRSRSPRNAKNVTADPAPEPEASSEPAPETSEPPRKRARDEKEEGEVNDEEEANDEDEEMQTEEMKRMEAEWAANEAKKKAAEEAVKRLMASRSHWPPLFRDADGDQAHEFWEETRPGNGDLRKVTKGLTEVYKS